MSELLSQAWEALTPAHEFILAILLTLFTAIPLYFLRPKVKLTWGSTSISLHKFNLSEEDQPVAISTEKIYVQNVGKKAATDVELILNDVPTSYTLWSPREHSSAPMEGGGYSIKIPSLAPMELLIVDIIDIDRRGLRLLAVNCPEALTQPVNFGVQRKFGIWVTGIVFYLMTAGAIGTIYLLLKLYFGDS